MYEEPIEIEESEEKPMESDEQGGVKMELVTLMMVMITMMHCWLRGGPQRSTMICREMPTTTPSFSHLYVATTLGALCSTGQSIGPTPTTPASR